MTESQTGDDLFSRRRAFETAIHRMTQVHGFKISPMISVMINRRYEQRMEIEPEGHGLVRLAEDLEEMIVGSLKMVRQGHRPRQG